MDFLARKGFTMLGAYNLSVDREGVAIQLDCLFENSLQATIVKV